MPAPLVAANYERAKLIPVDRTELSPGFVRLDPTTSDIAKNFASYTGGLYRGAKAGETIAFQFKGTYAALYDIIGPDCGQVIIRLDDQPARIVPRFDSFCLYHRLATLLIGADLPNTLHTVKIEIHPDQPDKAAILAQRSEKMDKVERFKDIAVYPGALLIVGELKRP